jgi:hypothetical protein
MRATDGKLHSLILRAGGQGLPVPAIVVGSILFVSALSVFLFVRRAAGALTAPLPTLQLVATAAVMLIWAVIVREFTAKRPLFFWISLSTLLLVAVACSFPAVRVVDWLVWLPAIGVVAALPFTVKGEPENVPTVQPQLANANDTLERVLQQVTRLRTAEGNDAVRATLTAEFAPGDRQTTAYVGFCPPFELLPEVEANIADDSEADVKLTQVLHNGAQLEVRLSEPAEEATAVSIELFAIAGV